MQYKLKNWLARGWELEGYGKGREKVPGWGGSETKNTQHWWETLRRTAADWVSFG